MLRKPYFGWASAAFVGAAALLFSASAAQADVIVYDFDKKYDPTDFYVGDTFSNLYFTFSILDDANWNVNTGLTGTSTYPVATFGCRVDAGPSACSFNPLSSSYMLLSAVLDISLKNGSGTPSKAKSKIFLDGIEAHSDSNADGASFYNDISALTALQNNGLLQVLINEWGSGGTASKFQFDYAQLTGQYSVYTCNPNGDPALNPECQDGGSTGQNEVPEPTTLAIFGAGLVGFSAIRRRRRKAQAKA